MGEVERFIVERVTVRAWYIGQREHAAERETADMKQAIAIQWLCRYIRSVLVGRQSLSIIVLPEESFRRMLPAHGFWLLLCLQPSPWRYVLSGQAHVLRKEIL